MLSNSRYPEELVRAGRIPDQHPGRDPPDIDHMVVVRIEDEARLLGNRPGDGITIRRITRIRLILPGLRSILISLRTRARTSLHLILEHLRLRGLLLTKLDAPPVFDGISAAGGNIYLSIKNGCLQCWR